MRLKKLNMHDLTRQQMQLTEYQRKYYAYELTKRCPADSLEKLAGALGPILEDGE